MVCALIMDHASIKSYSSWYNNVDNVIICLRKVCSLPVRQQRYWLNSIVQLIEPLNLGSVLETYTCNHILWLDWSNGNKQMLAVAVFLMVSNGNNNMFESCWVAGCCLWLFTASKGCMLQKQDTHIPPIQVFTVVIQATVSDCQASPNYEIGSVSTYDSVIRYTAGVEWQ